LPPARRFPPPWTVEETDACFIVKDHAGTSLAYVYFEDEPGRRAAARRSILGNKSSAFIAILRRWFRILLQGASVSTFSSFRAVPKVPS
jgi:hypothetical protein